MKKTLLALTLVFIASGAHAYNEDEPEDIFINGDWAIEDASSLTIRADGGGNIHEYAMLIDSLGKKKVSILGTCKSSCTMFLGHSNVCVAPDASFGFHGPSSDNQSISYLTALVEKIANYQSPVVAEHFRTDWGLNRDFTWLTGQELLDLDPSLRACN